MLNNFCYLRCVKNYSVNHIYYLNIGLFTLDFYVVLCTFLLRFLVVCRHHQGLHVIVKDITKDYVKQNPQQNWPITNNIEQPVDKHVSINSEWFQYPWHWINYKRGNVRINVILRRVRVTIVTVKSNKYYALWVCVCRLSYPARKAHAPNCIVICGLPGCTIFFTLSHKQYDLKKSYWA
jgi:hypothetical protein